MKENPFLIHRYKGPEYFCDRQEETANIINALKNGCNITLISPRRYGKTGLIHNNQGVLQGQRHIAQAAPVLVALYSGTAVVWSETQPHEAAVEHCQRCMRQGNILCYTDREQRIGIHAP